MKRGVVLDSLRDKDVFWSVDRILCEELIREACGVANEALLLSVGAENESSAIVCVPFEPRILLNLIRLGSVLERFVGDLVGG